MYIAQKLIYNTKSITKVSVEWECERPYQNIETAMNYVKSYLGYINKVDTHKNAKGEFMAIMNENGELEMAYYLYDGIVDRINVYDIESLEQFIVDMNEYRID